MKNEMLQLSETLSIPITQYASQGNAILGIRDSGKTYTGTWIAERLLDAHVPIIVFDPVGVWRHLKVGRDKLPGYEIVVVGGEKPDIQLQPNKAADVTRAALKENVSLIFDMFDVSLSKAQWRHVVEEALRVLLYENKSYGLRHIFIEEAAEWIPQKIRPEEGRLYAEFEKLGRMGRNFSLGYTLVNQRAEEVNKAILELCDCLFLHKQKGKNSIVSLDKWLTITETDYRKEIVSSLTQLPQGECWAWAPGSNKPERIKIPEKNTVHPNPRNPTLVLAGHTVDVSSFVYRLKAILEKEESVREQTGHTSDVRKRTEEKNPFADELEMLRKDNQKLREQLSGAERDAHQWKSQNRALTSKLNSVKQLLQPQYDSLRKLFEEIGENGNQPGAPSHAWSGWLEKLGSERVIIQILLDKPTHRATKQQLIVLGKIGRETVRLYTNKLIAASLIKKEGDEFTLAEIE
jgi:hypothetical protein